MIKGQNKKFVIVDEDVAMPPSVKAALEAIKKEVVPKTKPLRGVAKNVCYLDVDTSCPPPK